MFLSRGGTGLSPRARDAIVDEGTRLSMSPIFAWELYVKIAAGRLTLPEPVQRYVGGLRAAYGIELIDLTESDLMPLAGLPVHYRDPFGRALLAQSIARRMVLISPDPALRKYESVEVLW